jgi:hypothetical protein
MPTFEGLPVFQQGLTSAKMVVDMKVTFYIDVAYSKKTGTSGNHDISVVAPHTSRLQECLGTDDRTVLEKILNTRVNCVDYHISLKRSKTWFNGWTYKARTAINLSE